MLYDRIKFLLKYDGKSVEIQEPKGWDSARLTWLRSRQYHGIAITVSTPLEFYGNGAEELTCLYDDFGVNASAVLEIWKKDELSDIFGLFFIGVFDFKTIVFKEGVLIKFNASDVATSFKKQSKTKVEYGRTTRLDGSDREQDPIESIRISDVKNTKVSSVYMTNHTSKEYTMSFDASGDWRQNSLPLNLRFENECYTPDHLDMAEVLDSDNWTSKPNEGGIKYSFWKDSDNTSTLNVDISVNLRFKVAFEGIVDNRRYQLVLVVFDTSGNYSRTLRTLYTKSNMGDGIIAFSLSTSLQINIAKNESVSIQHRFGGNFGNFWKRGRYKINFVGYTNTANITVTSETSTADDTTNSIKVLDFFKCISDVTMNADFESGYLTNGLFKDLMIANGFMLRKFLDMEQGYIPPTISFSDLYDSLNVLSPVGVELTTKLTLEDVNYFYGDFIYADLGKVNDFEMSIDSSVQYSQVNIGFSKAEKNEEGGSLAEFNVSTEYVTTLRGGDKNLKLMSKVRGDSTGISKAKLGVVNEDETAEECKDDKEKSGGTDNDLWFIDSIAEGLNYRAAIWSDHFSKEPEGIVNGVTYYNFRFTPGNIARRHIPSLRQGYNNVREMALVFGSTKGLSSLRTFPNGQNVVKEDINVDMNLVEPLSLGLIAKFSTYHKFGDLSGMAVNGSRNFYGLLKFTSNNQTYLGYILKVSLESNKSVVECLIKVIIK